MTLSFPSLLVLLPLLSGCYHYAPVRVTVRDGQDHVPMAGVALRPAYAYVFDPFAPDQRLRFTDVNGQAIVPVATDYYDKSGRGPRPNIFIQGDFFIDQPLPATIVPIDEATWATMTSAGRAAAPIEIDVLPAEDWRKKYGGRSGAP